MAGSIAVVVAWPANAQNLQRVVADLAVQSRPPHDIVVALDGSEDLHKLQVVERLRRDGVRPLQLPSNRMLTTLHALDTPASDYLVLVTRQCWLDSEYLARTANTLDDDPTADFVCGTVVIHTNASVQKSADALAPLSVMSSGSIPHPAPMFRLAAVNRVLDERSVENDDDLDVLIIALRSGGRSLVLDDVVASVPEDQADLLEASSSPSADRLRRLYCRHCSATDYSVLLGLKDAAIGRLRARGGELETLVGELTNDVAALREEIQTLTRTLRLRSEDRVAWGDLRRLTPVSLVWGSDRGKPVNRYYIEQFLATNRGDIRGRVLEVKDSSYADAFGSAVTRVDVLDINPANPRASIVADLTTAEGIPSDTFDCFILTQVLNVVFDAKAVLRHAVRVLRPGGVLLCTVASVDRISYEDRGCDGDFWRFTAASLRALLSEVCPLDHFEVTTYGNVFTCAAHLYGFATEELVSSELDANDPAFPLIVAARVVKPGADEGLDG